MSLLFFCSQSKILMLSGFTKCFSAPLDGGEKLFLWVSSEGVKIEKINLKSQPRNEGVQSFVLRLTPTPSRSGGESLWSSRLPLRASLRLRLRYACAVNRSAGG